MKKILVLALFCLSIGYSNAQQQYIRKVEVPVNKNMAALTALDTIKRVLPENWVGKKIIFAPILKIKQKYGYTDFQGGTGMLGRPAYEECVGKIATITAVKADSGEYSVKVKLDENGKEYTGKTINNALSRIVFIEDLDSAQARFNKRMIWNKRDILYTFDDQKEKVGIINGQQFKVAVCTGVYIGFDDNAPIQLWLQNQKGEVGYVNINISNSNVESSLLYKNAFSYYFYAKDPSALCNCTPDLWKVIQNRQVQEGMTMDQARMSWGEPKEEIEEAPGSIRFKYSSGSTLLFVNGLLKEMNY